MKVFNFPFLFVLAFAFCLNAVSVGVSAHTYGIGVEPGEGGAVNVWWKSWHDCPEAPDFEGSVKVEGVEGTNYGPEVVQFTLSTCDENDANTPPSFLSPTDAGMMCRVDAAGNITSIQPTWLHAFENPVASLGYDPNDPILEGNLSYPPEYNNGANYPIGAHGAILCTVDEFAADTAWAWQGAAITGLSAGKYRVTYLDCSVDAGDSSDCDNGSSPSAKWRADNALVVSTVVEVSSAIVDSAGGGTSSVPVPTLPVYALLLMSGFLGLFGLRRLRG